MRHPQRGLALTTVLIVVTLVALAAFSMAALASFNYNLARNSQLSTEAFEAAQSGLAYAMSVLEQSPTWGTKSTDALPETTLNPAATGSTGDTVHFVVSFQSTPGLPTSVNNLAGPGIAVGPPDPANHNLPRQVPPHSALLFVQGSAGQGGQVRTRTLEAIVQFPASTYAMLASNSIVSWRNGCGYHTGSSGPPSCVAPGACSGHPFAVTVDGQTGLCTTNSPLKANIFAGYQWDVSPRYSVFLGPQSVVMGTVDAYAPCCSTPSTNVVVATPPVAGCPPEADDVEAASVSQQIPDVNINCFNNSGAATSVICVSHPVVSCNVYLKGPAPPCAVYNAGSPPPRSKRLVLGAGTDCSVSASPTPLILDHGTLFVDGNLEVPGGIVGPPGPCGGYQVASGSIYVTGATWICVRPQDPALISGDGIAIFSQQDLNLFPVGWNGSGSANEKDSTVNVISGSLYTHGNINFEQGIHVFGAMVAAGQRTNLSTGNIFMAYGGHVTYIPSMSHFSTTIGGSSGSSGATSMTVTYIREIVPPP